MIVRGELGVVLKKKPLPFVMQKELVLQVLGLLGVSFPPSHVLEAIVSNV